MQALHAEIYCRQTNPRSTHEQIWLHNAKHFIAQKCLFNYLLHFNTLFKLLLFVCNYGLYLHFNHGTYISFDHTLWPDTIYYVNYFEHYPFYKFYTHPTPPSLPPPFIYMYYYRWKLQMNQINNTSNREQEGAAASEAQCLLSELTVLLTLILPMFYVFRLERGHLQIWSFGLKTSTLLDLILFWRTRRKNKIEKIF